MTYFHRTGGGGHGPLGPLYPLLIWGLISKYCKWVVGSKYIFTSLSSCLLLMFLYCLDACPSYFHRTQSHCLHAFCIFSLHCLLCPLHRDRCVCLERVTVKMSGDACNRTHEWQRLSLNIVILLHFLFFISLILHSMLFCSSQKLSMASKWISKM